MAIVVVVGSSLPVSVCPPCHAWMLKAPCLETTSYENWTCKPSCCISPEIADLYVHSNDYVCSPMEGSLAYLRSCGVSIVRGIEWVILFLSHVFSVASSALIPIVRGREWVVLGSTSSYRRRRLWLPFSSAPDIIYNPTLSWTFKNLASHSTLTMAPKMQYGAPLSRGCEI